uniref:FAD-binding domain-containing protein n=1 Tax=Setaria viridis TaxID=4556 RepID=A0A4U6UXX2_SETVI|nr:hypothetical protein SEVIR_4G127801v2 [Setaria viridis]
MASSEQLGLATELRETADIITMYHNVWQKQNKTTLNPTRKELRCLKRKDLVEALAKNLPVGTIRFGCHISKNFEDSDCHCTVLSTVDGSTIKARVLIGCDGANSMAAQYLGLGSPSHLPRLVHLGFTSYLHGHPFGTRFLRFAAQDFAVGRMPVNENLVHFFVTRSSPSTPVHASPTRVLRESTCSRSSKTALPRSPRWCGGATRPRQKP